MQIEIEDLSSKGMGVGRHNQKVVFVPNAILNEKVLCTKLREGQNIIEADLLEIIEPSSSRVKPLCPKFGLCGGCQLQHMNYEAQLDFKRKRVNDCIQRIGKWENIEVELTRSSPPWAYRNKLQLPVRNKKVGFFGAKSHQFIPIDHCYLHLDPSQKILNQICELSLPEEIDTLTLKTAYSSQEIMVIFSSFSKLTSNLEKFAALISKKIPSIKSVYFTKRNKASNFVFGEVFTLLYGQESIIDELMGLKFSITKDAFYQVNPFQVEGLYTHALNGLDLSLSDVFLDAFCGVGTMTLLAAKKCKKAIGIECVESSIESAKKNQQLNQIENAEFILGKAEEKILDLKKVTKAVINPPRKGCEPSFIEAIKKLPVEKIAYVSCDPATFARDSYLLSSHYQLERVVPFDLFPQTTHVETVGHFKRITD